MPSAEGRGQGHSARPVLREKTAYAPKSRQERYIVGLLKDAIESGLDQYAANGGRALDVGCGGKPFRAHLESRGMRYTSLDTQQQPGMTTDFICAIDGDLPSALGAGTRGAGGESRSSFGPFDLILCTEVLEHVADWDTAWVNLRSLLAPGGVLILTCPFIYPLHEEPYDFYRPTAHAIRHWADKSGLEIVEQRNLGTAWDVLGTVIGGSGPKPASPWPHAWILATLAQFARKLACWLISTGLPARCVRTKPTMYLGNYAVLRCPMSPDPREQLQMARASSPMHSLRSSP
jgi:SAM-dependent methyltransferase